MEPINVVSYSREPGLTSTPSTKPGTFHPVAPAQRSTAAQTKASRRTTADGAPAYSFRALLERLATLTRNDIRYGTDTTMPAVPTLAAPTQTRAG
ncbi:hypothetical protein [Arthrobacter sp. A5]|uniref:hypothetical protein n=1 Tax=Arthrobacter sp. A5 TaxID=576926 RepID=UPI003DA9684B